MSEKITVDVTDRSGSCGLLLIGFVLMSFLFSGDPDIQDLCIEWLHASIAQMKPTP